AWLGSDGPAALRKRSEPRRWTTSAACALRAARLGVQCPSQAVAVRTTFPQCTSASRKPGRDGPGRQYTLRLLGSALPNAVSTARSERDRDDFRKRLGQEERPPRKLEHQPPGSVDRRPKIGIVIVARGLPIGTGVDTDNVVCRHVPPDVVDADQAKLEVSPSV